MRVENISLPKQSGEKRVEQAQEDKTKVVARDVFASLPTMGIIDPCSWTIGAVLAGVTKVVIGSAVVSAGVMSVKRLYQWITGNNDEKSEKKS
ncbi:MAG TPA: hypothetical protein VLE96_05515 [Chlamydiales bacterium]|nr:hypothetical protein [Chlamydiales bacterium]